MELTVGEETAQNIPFMGIFGEQGWGHFFHTGSGQKGEKKSRERGKRLERERDGRKADRSLRYGRWSVCYATPPVLNVDQIVLMMPEGDKGKTDLRDTEFCGERLVGS
ncbi:hypothetical protein Bca52824_074840 [Brassica carinata]|uniref:Uncharacterized protein n=1 Tax=Brassica carinata TaxID=52824 RepID=A0A8X7TXD3_BRACI|nr:hypothetical protein Bca52824_074840 [Brassica carinata]